MTPHIRRSILISSNSSLFSWLFIVDHASTKFIRLTATVLYLAASFCHTTLPSTSSNFPMLHSLCMFWMSYLHIHTTAMFLQGTSTKSWHRTEKDGERQSWRSTPDSDNIGKGTQRYAMKQFLYECDTHHIPRPSDSVSECDTYHIRSLDNIVIVRTCDVYNL